MSQLKHKNKHSLLTKVEVVFRKLPMDYYEPQHVLLIDSEQRCKHCECTITVSNYDICLDCEQDSIKKYSPKPQKRHYGIISDFEA